LEEQRSIAPARRRQYNQWRAGRGRTWRCSRR
jgi:hypothetical protein